MHDMFGSVRRSLVFRPPDGDDHSGTLVDKINSCIRKSRVFTRTNSILSSPQPVAKEKSENVQTIRWRKGELIGCGAFGQVYMGMNLDSGELLAVKQVSIAANSGSKEKTQIHIRELEEEVKLLKNLSHQNIVRYLGTVREDSTLNILLEFVPGGSISSLLGKFGPFPETVIRMYTKQLLLGLDYLHGNGIMHRDIKGANILVDNKGCIKLADFGASKQVVELANGPGAKSMKGTPYWMAPEVILQTGHSFTADIWSVGCTVIEMATGKPPWSQQYQEVAALFYIGTTKSHPPIPDQLSPEAQDLLLKCLHKEPELRPSASDLLQHPFVTGKSLQTSFVGTPTLENIEAPPSAYTSILNHSPASLDVCNMGTFNVSPVTSGIYKESKRELGTRNSDNDMCQLDGDDFMESGGEKLRSVSVINDFTKSFNPMEEPSIDGSYKLQQATLDGEQHSEGHVGHSFSEDDDELTECKIKAFLDEKASELKRLQTPLYEEFYNSVVPSCLKENADVTGNGSSPNYLKLPPKSKSPSRFPLGTPNNKAIDAVSNASPVSGSRRTLNFSGDENSRSPMDISSPQCDDMSRAESEPEASSPGVNVVEVKRKWKEELDQELERQRGINLALDDEASSRCWGKNFITE
ncbi:mitogen-activated protein kinase kinase kinase ANP1-like isoform X2 [Rutidosis leptorrhynchoides]|uniref:mitogen-activated protein kinase kinase kinase ANP1-like isoform X2 n=1 Tax=Rutidosis leptorrhynchoides TaxID=125765 RepID=UPI003A9949AD